MYRCLLTISLKTPMITCCARLPTLGLQRATLATNFSVRSIQTQSSTQADLEAKYLEKLKERAAEKGLTVDELKAKIREEERTKLQQKRQKEVAAAGKADTAEAGAGATGEKQPYSPKTVRKDNSPVQPLSSLLNVSKILSASHTPEQVSALWTAYHLSRSGGTGRGFVCAAVPVELYNKMLSTAISYPAFVVPVPRKKSPEEIAEVQKGEETGMKENDTAYEFYFLQWNFYGSPPVPSVVEDPFNPPEKQAKLGQGGANPQISTVLFTPLQEYKSRQAYATPYLILTHYTDLVETHGLVLLRGEITPSSTSSGGGADGKYMLSQDDAQLLAVALQKFYLWGGQKDDGAKRLLQAFWEKPEDFKWEDLLKQADYGI